MGNYALGLGVVKALSQGMEGKFRERLGRAEQLDRRYERGAIDTAWGRFYDKLPWPKRDREQAELHFKRAVEVNNFNLRARLPGQQLHRCRSPGGRQAPARRGRGGPGESLRRARGAAREGHRRGADGQDQVTTTVDTAEAGCGKNR
jgi:hypothetical protein